ncbi:MAG: hypothetical protein DRH24_20430 [Deltaproteobacteria bacterium]|nr:MAG: hypothetical protein DRH24_20430 [Deltaproteobacteria bacterium]
MINSYDLVKKDKIEDEYPKIFKEQLKRLEESKVSWRKYTTSGLVGTPARHQKKEVKDYSREW